MEIIVAIDKYCRTSHQIPIEKDCPRSAIYPVERLGVAAEGSKKMPYPMAIGPLHEYHRSRLYLLDVCARRSFGGIAD